jgi:hypothetical protein
VEDLTYSTPGLLFPAISLLMLAYTNRFLTLAGLVRHLAMEYRHDHNCNLKLQIDNLRLRITLLRHCQTLGVLSLLLVTGSLTALFFESQLLARVSFAVALLAMLGSLAFSLSEIRLSGTALNIELDRVEAAPKEEQA